MRQGLGEAANCQGNPEGIWESLKYKGRYGGWGILLFIMSEQENVPLLKRLVPPIGREGTSPSSL